MYGYQFQPTQEVIKVNGENGAKTYQMPPNSSVLLLDTTEPIVWLKTTDSSCFPTITGYRIEPIEAPPKDRFEQLENRIAELERRLTNESNIADAE